MWQALHAAKKGKTCREFWQSDIESVRIGILEGKYEAMLTASYTTLHLINIVQ